MIFYLTIERKKKKKNHEISIKVIQQKSKKIKSCNNCFENSFANPLKQNNNSKSQLSIVNKRNNKSYLIIKERKKNYDIYNI